MRISGGSSRILFIQEMLASSVICLHQFHYSALNMLQLLCLSGIHYLIHSTVCEILEVTDNSVDIDWFFISMALKYFCLTLADVQFLNLYAVSGTLWTGDQPIARPLPKQRSTQTQNKAHRHLCLQWASNPRSQCSSERRRFMP
jgi:hypothetical protein